MAKFIEKRSFLSIETLQSTLNIETLKRRKNQEHSLPPRSLAMSEISANAGLSALPRRSRRTHRKANRVKQYVPGIDHIDDSMFEQTDSDTSEDEFDPSPKKAKGMSERSGKAKPLMKSTAEQPKLKTITSTSQQQLVPYSNESTSKEAEKLKELFDKDFIVEEEFRRRLANLTIGPT